MTFAPIPGVVYEVRLKEGDVKFFLRAPLSDMPDGWIGPLDTCVEGFGEFPEGSKMVTANRNQVREPWNTYEETAGHSAWSSARSLSGWR
jgi:hypothetical protein